MSAHKQDGQPMQDLSQPTNSNYKLARVDIGFKDAQVELAAWISAHPSIEIMSVTAINSAYLLVVYRDR